MRGRILFLSICLFFPTALFAQQIIGSVKDADTGETLAGVNIVYGPNQGTATDAAGKYSIRLKTPGEYWLEFRYIGYLSQRKKIVVSSGEPVQLHIALKTDQANLNPVVVTAGRYEQRQNEVTVSMEVLKPSLIQNNNSTKFDDALDRVSGVSVLNGQANIRGTSGFSYGAGSRVLVLVDDMPLLSADAGDVKWAYIPIENVAQIEVIKGASSALFGSSALGGIVNLRSAYPTGQPKTQIQTFFGLYGQPRAEFKSPFPDQPNFQTGLSALHSQQFGKLDFTAGMYSIYDEGYRIGDYSKRIRANVNLRYRITDRWSIGLNVNAMRDSSGNFFFWESDTAAFYPSPGTNDVQLGIRYNIDPFVQYIGKSGQKHSFRNRYYFTENRGSADRNTKGHVYYNEYQYQRPLKLPFAEKSMLTVGGVHIYNGIESGVLYGNRDSRNLAAYLQFDQNFNRLNYSFGFRYESFVINRETPINYPVFRGGMNYRLLKASWLRASFGQGFRTPSVAERYANAAAGGILIVPNPNLGSESGWSSEVALRQGWRWGKFSGMIDLSGFWTQFDNMIEFQLATTAFGFQAVNLSERLTRIRGLELSTGTQGEIGKIAVQLQLGHTYIQPIERFTPVPSLPELTLDSVLKYRSNHLFRGDIDLRSGRWQGGVNVRYNSFVKRIDQLFEVAIPGVAAYRQRDNQGDWLFDLRLGYDLFENLTANFIIRNLTNEAYMIVPGNIGAARNYIIQLTYRHGG